MAKFLTPDEPLVAPDPPNVLLELAPVDVQGLFTLVWEKRRTLPKDALKAIRFYDQLDAALSAANLFQAKARFSEGVPS